MSEESNNLLGPGHSLTPDDLSASEPFARAAALAELRAKVEDLPAVLFPGSRVLWLDRADVLALIDGGLK